MRWFVRLLFAPFLAFFLLLTEYPRIDRWRRPLILLPGSKKEQSFTRVTTVAKTLDGGEALVEWKEVMVAGGAALRPDILAQVAANWPRTEETKRTLGKLAESLKEAAASSAGANLGDALHAMVARINRGETFRPVPPWDVDCKIYQDLLERSGIRVVPEMVERTVVLPKLGIAGSFDFLGEKASQLFVCDLKTGQKLDYSWLAICMQLSLYAMAETLYDWDNRTHSPMPKVNQKQGLVIHLPAGAGQASLHVVDLELGRAAVEVALTVRDWRKRNDLARPANF